MHRIEVQYILDQVYLVGYNKHLDIEDFAISHHFPLTAPNFCQ